MLQRILSDLKPTNTRLIAVSKTKPVAKIEGLYQEGQRDFGENRIQELVEKQAQLPSDIRWHFIGHLQTNKVKQIAPFVQLIHAVDSLKLLREINKQAVRQERVIACLLQFKIAEEDSKYGLSINDGKRLLQHPDFRAMRNVQIAGVMGMATFTTDMQQVRQEFQRLKSYFDLLKSAYFADKPDFKEISMGMSGDYKVAIEEGSTMVRIGSLLFGARHYE